MRDLKDRFFAKVVKINNGCWEWNGSMTPNGYGQIWYKNRLAQAHRVSWIIANGDIPEGLKILHKCDNRKCVNPDHLFIGTQRDNILDMIKKGRCKRTNINEQQVREMRKLSQEGKTSVEIAPLYNMDPANVRKIVSRRSWKHVV